MKKNIKVERAVYAAWDYELELKHLNEMSEQGWQLIQGGCFHTKYEWDDSVVYRYQLDHNMKIENRLRYVDTYREQGWEYINSTFNGWHYFRKVYDPAKSAEEYEIYSDRPSKEEMAGRLGRLLAVLSIVVGLLFAASLVSFILEPSMAMIGIIAEMLAALILAGTGTVRMRSVGRGERSARKFPVAAMAAVVAIGLMWFMVFASAEHRSMANWSHQTDGAAVLPFEMTLPDWVDVSVILHDAQKMAVTISDDNGFEKVYETVRNADLNPDTALVWQVENLFLMPGDYTVQAQWDETDVAVSIEID
ncbi:MAG: DUF2812 domain-containing protein [Clostridia bacterium]|nr:DUF2812 domain-containing protein [Clostridia bacterium]